MLNKTFKSFYYGKNPWFNSGRGTRTSITQEVSAAAIKKTILLVNPSYLLVCYERVTKLHMIVLPFKVCLTFEHLKASFQP